MASRPNVVLKEEHRERVVANYWRRWGERHSNKPVAAVVGVRRHVTEAEEDANHREAVAAMTRRVIALREAREVRERERAARVQQRREAQEQAARVARRLRRREARRVRARAQLREGEAPAPAPVPAPVPEPRQFSAEFPNLLDRPVSSYLRR